mmetsp:Transcript_4847/g.10878  ORF Transcript_4847/g.10878 Transcript_4847/m.10878 type:complete len:358 (+) Transcript_4847:912-1985(+)
MSHGSMESAARSGMHPVPQSKFLSSESSPSASRMLPRPLIPCARVSHVLLGAPSSCRPVCSQLLPCPVVRARWGKTAHLTFLFFGFCANIIVTAMLLLGGAATVEALTGVNYELASFLIPWGVILYTSAGGLKATFMASYLHTMIIFAVLITMITVVYIKVYSADQMYDFLDQTVSYTTEQCEAIYSTDGTPETSFFMDDSGKKQMACGPVAGNVQGSYLTMISSGGLMFGIINIIGNFGTVFVDQSYWQSAIAARPSSAARGYLLGGIICASTLQVRDSLLFGYFAWARFDCPHAPDQLWRGWLWTGPSCRGRPSTWTSWIRSHLNHALYGHCIDGICREYRRVVFDRLRYLPRIL